jgi:glyoxalase/bleomycin resistance protein/dioxygenase superfamily protein
MTSPTPTPLGTPAADSGGQGVSAPLASQTITQVGIMVQDIDATAQAWAHLLGVPVPDIIITDTVDIAHTEYQQQPTPARAKLAFFPLGQVTLELIEPIDTPSTWNDHLTARGPSLHHIAFQVNGLAGLLPVLAAQGMPLVQRGDYEGGRYAYLDGQQRFGAVVELLEND